MVYSPHTTALDQDFGVFFFNHLFGFLTSRGSAGRFQFILRCVISGRLRTLRPFLSS